jgi:CDP-2,3-bis-(O-geranylgeranyl)-sn-glycerol synthase
MQFWLVDELLLMLVATNGFPVVVGILAGHRWNTPLDGSLVMQDGYRLLGPSKTIRGLIAAILAGTLASPLADLSYVVGASFGCLAMIGDLGSSYLKRRLGYTASCSRPLLDQLPECLLPLLVLQPIFASNLPEILTATGAFIAFDLLVTRLLRPFQPTCR